MNKREKKICGWLLERPGYVKWSALKVAKISGLPGYPKEFENALKMAKNTLKEDIEEPEVTSKGVKGIEPLFKRLYFDIETSYNTVASFMIGNKISIGYENILKERSIICVSYKWAHEDTVHTYTWNKGNDKQLLANFLKVLDTADEIIGHNSDNFDIKWLRTRCLYHGLPMFPKYQSVDTLKIARQYFRFNSNRLDYIAQYLDVGSKTDTGGLKLWKAVVDGDIAALAQMVSYCENDVLILEEVFNKFNPYINSKTHVGVIKGFGKDTCPECGSNHTQSRGYSVSAAGSKKQRKQCQDCGKYFTLTVRKKD